MENHEKESAVLKMIGQYLELVIVFLRKLHPVGLTTGQIKSLIEEKDHPFWVAFNEAAKLLAPQPIPIPTEVLGLVTHKEEVEKQFALWRKIYSEEGIELPADEGLWELLPKHQQGFDWMIITSPGMTINRAWAICKKRFACWNPDRDLESEMRKSERGETKEISITWVRDRVEADEEMKSLSADDLEKQKVKGITVLKRLLLEVFYFERTGKHLDIKNWTLCSGSRGSGGGVPSAGWYDGEFSIGWDYAGFRDSDLRSRVAVG